MAKRVCRERNWNLGQLVGYKVGLDKGNSSKDTRLLYVTTGVLIKMLISQKNMSQWTHIIIDEVHERDKDMDFLLLQAARRTSNTSETEVALAFTYINTYVFNHMVFLVALWLSVI